ncbi:hypothetical protein GCM10010211_81610 [Streptomyces albospinus]|uniref:Uncharacterized protein n=1 Tax=Streptomyces albospinus TaxID=285515 RepID=A0ABQ2VND1_9ACTN|nr:hypothetical protein GCM10010211_81610 [Streptomyces albospinus]
MLTEARRITPWLREGSSFPQQQVIRNFPDEAAQCLGHQVERVVGDCRVDVYSAVVRFGVHRVGHHRRLRILSAEERVVVGGAGGFHGAQSHALDAGAEDAYSDDQLASTAL